MFIINLNDRVFPSVNNVEGFLNDNDRISLENVGIELAGGTLEQLYEDQFNIYRVFTAAEEKIFLSYLLSDKEGRALRPSILVSRVKKMFPKLEEKSDILEKDEEILIPGQAFEELLQKLDEFKNGKEIDKIWFRVYNWYNSKEEWKEKLEKAIQAVEYGKETKKLSSKNIQNLYGTTLNTSISRLEQYRACPFSYYLKYGLKLKEKSEFKINPIDTGSFMHDVISNFFEMWDGEYLSEKEIRSIVDNIVDEKLSLPKNYIYTSANKFIVLTKRLKKVVTKSIEYILYQIKNSDFNILGNEVEFKEEIENVKLTGKIDRIDVAESEEGKYIRVIDYKSSSKDVNIGDIEEGINLQLITYIDQVSKKENAIPAGVLYFNLIDPVVKSAKNLSDEEIEKKIKKEFKMKGLVLADVKVIKMMDKNIDQGESYTIPVEVNKDGTISKKSNSAITREEFSKLQETVKKVIKEIGDEILSGKIDIDPMYDTKTKEPVCKYCKYKSICAYVK